MCEEFWVIAPGSLQQPRCLPAVSPSCSTVICDLQIKVFHEVALLESCHCLQISKLAKTLHTWVPMVCSIPRFRGFPSDSLVKNLAAMQETCKRDEFHSWVGKIPWRRKQQPTPGFLLGKFHGQRSQSPYNDIQVLPSYYLSPCCVIYSAPVIFTLLLFLEHTSHTFVFH